MAANHARNKQSYFLTSNYMAGEHTLRDPDDDFTIRPQNPFWDTEVSISHFPVIFKSKKVAGNCI